MMKHSVITFEIIDLSHPYRKIVEDMIKGVYLREYNASVTTFADTLVALRGIDGAVLAAAGVRIGNNFFSEIYLDQPIEACLAEYWSGPVSRNEVAEVTTLASLHPKAVSRLFVEIIHYMRDGGANWAFFTVTERLRMMLKRMGVTALDLGRADPARIAGNLAQWGTYYVTNPTIIAIHDTMAFIPGSEAKNKVGDTVVQSLA